MCMERKFTIRKKGMGEDPESKVYLLRIGNGESGGSLRASLERLFAEASMMRSSMIPFFGHNGLSGYDVRAEHGICIDSEGRIREFEYRALSLRMRMHLMERFVEEMEETPYRLRPGRVTEITFPVYGKTHAVMNAHCMVLEGIREYIPAEGIENFWNKEGVTPGAFTLKHDSENDTFTVKALCRVRREERSIVSGIKEDDVLGLYFEPYRGIWTSEGNLIRAAIETKPAGKDDIIDTKTRVDEMERLDDMHREIMERLSSYSKIVMIDNGIALPETYQTGAREFRSIQCRIRDELLEKKNTIKMSPFLKAPFFCRHCGTFASEWIPNRTWKCRNCGHEEEKGRTAAENLVWFYEHGIGLGKSQHFEIEDRVRKVFESVPASRIS